MKYWAFRGVALSLILSSIRDGRSFPPFSNHVIYFPCPDLHLPTYLPPLPSSTEGQHHSPFTIHLYCLQSTSKIYLLHCLSTFSIHIKDYEHRVQRFSTMPLHFSSFQTRTVAVAEQTATTAMPTMTPSNNLTNGDNTGLHKFNPFHNFNNAEFLASRYLFMLVQFFLFMIVGVFLMGLALCVIRYRAGVFRRVNRFLRTWWREIVWRFRTLNRSRIAADRNAAYIRRPGWREREGSV